MMDWQKIPWLGPWLADARNGSAFGHKRLASPRVERWVTLDVETSGLDMQRDQLLAIAAIGIQVDWHSNRLEIVPADSFEIVLRQEVTSSKDNILLHGIGVGQQRQGVAPPLALQQFLDFVGNAPLLAFHAAFDKTIIERFVRLHLKQSLRNEWVDIEHLCAVTHEQVRARSLDEWMAHFGIQCAVRHQAAADTLAECELLQVIWPRVQGQCSDWSGVKKLAAHQRWIARA
jgi:DNA polymerase-3 subunit epsilon